MSKVTITAEVNVTNVNHLQALNIFLATIGDVSIKQNPVTEEAKAPLKKVEDENKEQALSTEIIQGWSEKDMMSVDTDVLKDACKLLGIDYESQEGPNTNKKLRELILFYFKGLDSAKTTTTQAPPVEKTPPVETEATTSEGGPTIDDVRAAVTANVGTHRDAIKKKLTDLGANNVTSLDPTKFQEFLDFIELL